MSAPRRVSLTVNGIERSGMAEPRLTLLDFLRYELGLTGTHMGCEHGVCGACTVLFDGDAVRACLIYAVQAEGHAVETVEGLCNADGSPGPIQDAFRDAHGLQCGYCTPGMLISVKALLQATPDPSDDEIREAIGGNLCRCTGYTQIIDAVRLAAAKAKGAGT
ncbi:MAG: (2Fe-2S)-binding protein [Alphaproteobacteria bacterium]|nr:(2Fe-2S)-binding protein [Alphaproteobacteria bacterium]